MSLSQNLLRICKAQGISLAKLAKISGIPSQTLHGWTLGRKSVNLEHLRKVSLSLRVSVHELLYGTPDPHDGDTEVEIFDKAFSGDLRITLHKIVKKNDQ